MARFMTVPFMGCWLLSGKDEDFKNDAEIRREGTEIPRVYFISVPLCVPFGHE